MQKDFTKFANQRFLKTVNWEVLGKLLTTHRAGIKGLDLEALLADEVEGRKRIAEYLLGSKDSYPEGLIQDLHRIVRLDSPTGMRLLQEEAERQGVVIIDPADSPTATPRDYALVAFVKFPDVFREAEHTSVFIAPPSVTEFDAGEDGLAASVTKETLEALRVRASGIFAADLRGKFCRVRDYVDDGELCIAVRHGAPPVSTEVIRGDEDEVIGFQEVDTAVISFVEATGRLTVWGCAKKRRADLAEAFATEILGRPGVFKAASSQNLYTLAPAEKSHGTFTFRIGDLDQIERVEITEAQANRVATNVRTGREKTLFSVRVKDSEGSALRRLHESRADISYGDNAWRLDHIIARILLKTPSGRAPAISVTIKPPGSVTFPRVRHKKLVMALLKLNALTNDRRPIVPALAAE
ncbi:MAG: hypothetical protein IRZ07_06470 [Microbispora sp.]|nr:hypothetical protein [Microbispora sp.]